MAKHSNPQTIPTTSATTNFSAVPMTKLLALVTAKESAKIDDGVVRVGNRAGIDRRNVSGIAFFETDDVAVQVAKEIAWRRERRAESVRVRDEMRETYLREIRAELAAE